MRLVRRSTGRVSKYAQVALPRLFAPGLQQERHDSQYRNTEQVVVEHCVPIFEAHALNALAHDKHVCRTDQAVN